MQSTMDKILWLNNIGKKTQKKEFILSYFLEKRILYKPLQQRILSHSFHKLSPVSDSKTDCVHLLGMSQMTVEETHMDTLAQQLKK